MTPAESGAAWWEILAAVAAAFGALAGAVAAIAAWRSASASERTSRESRHALAAALRPRVDALGDLDMLLPE